jgi:hypothetical protein
MFRNIAGRITPYGKKQKEQKTLKKAGLAPGTLVRIGEKKLETVRITLLMK